MARQSAGAVAASGRARTRRLLLGTAATDSGADPGADPGADRQDERGAEREQATARALAALPSDVWRIFHDLRWPGRPRAGLDHVVVGPPGVFVIDTLRWNGAIGTEGGVLRHNGRRRERAAAGASAAAHAVAELLPRLDPTAVRPVLCFERDEPVFGWVGEVMVCSTANIVTMLTSRPAVLSPATVHTAGGQLHGQLQWSTAQAAARATHGRGRGGNRRGLLPRRLGPGSRRPSRFRSVVSILALGVLAVLAAALLSPFADVVEREARERLNPSMALGETVTVRGNPVRPELRVSVDDVRTTRVLRPRSLARTTSRVLVAEVTIRNTGQTTWVAGPTTGFAVLDAEGLAAEALDRRRGPRVVDVQGGGALLPARLRLAPRRSVRGLVVFGAPDDLEVRRVRVSVDPGLVRSYEWSLD